MFSHYLKKLRKCRTLMFNKTVFCCGLVFVQFHDDKVEEAFTAR